ncbi:Protein of uncharacterised function (DUF3170) [Yersinia pseudotuberculosis]|nr:Protein of uncharacterised function (DUF3170) [Yersinia pseudotuberculosis]
MLHRQCGQLGVNRHQRSRQGVNAHAHPGTGGIEQIHRFVRQLAAGQEAARQGNRCGDSGVQNMHAVMGGVTFFQATQHQAGGVIIRLVHFDHLEAALQCGIAFKILFVFGPGGGGDGAQFATRQCRFQQVGRIGTTGLITGPDNGVGFVDKQQHRAGGLLHRLDNIFQALFELAFDPGTGL